MRLDKFLVSQNIGSRKEASQLCRSGRVTVNGTIVKNSDLRIDAEKDIVCLDNTALTYSEHIYIMMNKPKGVLSASEDKKSVTVVDLVPEEWRRKDIFPAGRLDKNTTGLLIITDDGDFAHRMLAPKSHVWKLYRAELDLPCDERDIELFAEGIVSGENKFLPAELTFQDPDNRRVALVRIREGKFHQVKRMFSSCGKEVIELKRLSAGDLELDPTLSEGECRLLTEEEKDKIFVHNQ